MRRPGVDASSASILIVAIYSCCHCATAWSGPIFNPDNGHYYEQVAADHIRWDDARAAAAAMTYLGHQGHLATISSQTEQDFLFLHFGATPDLWLGASDASSEQDWFWVDGPEAGTQFYSSAGGATAYVFPGFIGGDSHRDEDYLVWNHNGASGLWNDYGIAGRAINPATEPLSGYLVEYSVPEPTSSTLALLGIGALLPFFRWRSRRRFGTPLLTATAAAVFFSVHAGGPATAGPIQSILFSQSILTHDTGSPSIVIGKGAGTHLGRQLVWPGIVVRTPRVPHPGPGGGSLYLPAPSDWDYDGRESRQEATLNDLSVHTEVETLVTDIPVLNRFNSPDLNSYRASGSSTASLRFADTLDGELVFEQRTRGDDAFLPGSSVDHLNVTATEFLLFKYRFVADQHGIVTATANFIDTGVDDWWT